MCTRRAGSVVLTMLALTSAVGRGDEHRKSVPENPDPSFLEFLGSVDRLADVNPDYLSQGRPQAPKPPAKDPAGSPPPAPAPPPTAASGVKNND